MGSPFTTLSIGDPVQKLGQVLIELKTALNERQAILGQTQTTFPDYDGKLIVTAKAWHTLLKEGIKEILQYTHGAFSGFGIGFIPKTSDFYDGDRYGFFTHTVDPAQLETVVVEDDPDDPDYAVRFTLIANGYLDGEWFNPDGLPLTQTRDVWVQMQVVLRSLKWSVWPIYKPAPGETCIQEGSTWANAIAASPSCSNNGTYGTTRGYADLGFNKAVSGAASDDYILTASASLQTSTSDLSPRDLDEDLVGTHEQTVTLLTTTSKDMDAGTMDVEFGDTAFEIDHNVANETNAVAIEGGWTDGVGMDIAASITSTIPSGDPFNHATSAYVHAQIAEAVLYFWAYPALTYE